MINKITLDGEFDCPYCDKSQGHDPEDAEPDHDYFYECDNCGETIILNIDYDIEFYPYKTKRIDRETPYGPGYSIVKAGISDED